MPQHIPGMAPEEKEWSGGSPQSAMMMLYDQGMAVLDGRIWILQNGQPVEYTPDMVRQQNEMYQGTTGRTVRGGRGVSSSMEAPGDRYTGNRKSYDLSLGQPDPEMSGLYADALAQDKETRWQERSGFGAAGDYERGHGFQSQPGVAGSGQRLSRRQRPGMPPGALSPGGSSYEDARRHSIGVTAEEEEEQNRIIREVEQRRYQGG